MEGQAMSVKTDTAAAAKASAHAVPRQASRAGTVERPSRADRPALGRDARAVAPLESQAEFQPAPGRDPVGLLLGQAASRVPELVPVRHGRMLVSPFTFYRGAALPMAADLAATPASGLRVQLCGDAHLSNFGAFASPERRLVFDVNDFDETLPCPFEWDVKRLAASLAVAGRVAQLTKRECGALACTAARSYRQYMAELAPMPPVVAWSQRIDLVKAVADIDSIKLRRKMQKRLADLLKSGARQFGLVEEHRGGLRIREKPPFVRRLDKHELHARKAFASYAKTLREDRRLLLQRYALQDVAFKVVGVGSVGTFCAIALMVSGSGAPMLLQI